MIITDVSIKINYRLKIYLSLYDCCLKIKSEMYACIIFLNIYIIVLYSSNCYGN